MSERLMCEKTQCHVYSTWHRPLLTAIHHYMTIKCVGVFLSLCHNWDLTELSNTRQWMLTLLSAFHSFNYLLILRPKWRYESWKRGQLTSPKRCSGASECGAWVCTYGIHSLGKASISSCVYSLSFLGISLGWGSSSVRFARMSSGSS